MIYHLHSVHRSLKVISSILILVFASQSILLLWWQDNSNILHFTHMSIILSILCVLNFMLMFCLKKTSGLYQYARELHGKEDTHNTSASTKEKPLSKHELQSIIRKMMPLYNQVLQDSKNDMNASVMALSSCFVDLQDHVQVIETKSRFSEIAKPTEQLETLVKTVENCLQIELDQMHSKDKMPNDKTCNIDTLRNAMNEIEDYVDAAEYKMESILRYRYLVDKNFKDIVYHIQFGDRTNQAIDNIILSINDVLDEITDLKMVSPESSQAADKIYNRFRARITTNIENESLTSVKMKSTNPDDYAFF